MWYVRVAFHGTHASLLHNAYLTNCTSIIVAVFANLYYEFNNEMLDHYDREQSNLKCAIYGDVHTAAEKTNWGGQQSYREGNALTYMQQSGGWASKHLVEPEVPEGYELVFGPTNGANNAPGVSKVSPSSKTLFADTSSLFFVVYGLCLLGQV